MATILPVIGSSVTASDGGSAVLLAPVGSTPAAEGASVSGATLTLQPADATHPGLLSLAVQSLKGLKTALDGLASDLLQSATAVSLVIKGSVANGASAVGVVLDTVNALTTAGAKLASFRTGGVEKTYIDKDGGVVPANNATANLGTAALHWGLGYIDQLRGVYVIDTGSVNRFVYSGGSPNQYVGGPVNGASAVGHTFQTTTAYSTAGARLASFQNLTTEAFAVHNDGKTIQAYTDASATPGAVTINKPTGRAAIAALASSVVVTNSTCTLTSIVMVQLETSGIGVGEIGVVPGAGSFTVTALNASGVATAVTGAATFSFIVCNL